MAFNRSQITHRPCMLENSDHQHLSSNILQVSGDDEVADILDMDVESDGDQVEE